MVCCGEVANLVYSFDTAAENIQDYEMNCACVRVCLGVFGRCLLPLSGVVLIVFGGEEPILSPWKLGSRSNSPSH